MLIIYFLATFYLGYFQNPKKMLPFLKKMLPILKKMLPILKKMLPFQLATFWYVVFLSLAENILEHILFRKFKDFYSQFEIARKTFAADLTVQKYGNPIWYLTCRILQTITLSNSWFYLAGRNSNSTAENWRYLTRPKTKIKVSFGIVYQSLYP